MNRVPVEGGGNNNIVMNSGIAGSYSQMAIALQASHDNVIVGNTIDVTTSFDGIFTDLGSLRNRIERNTITGHKVDGLLLNTSSNFNYLGLNTAVSRSYIPGSPTPPTQISGTGIWVNNSSNANYLFGNDLSGSPENGIDVLTSLSTFLVGNSVYGNWAGGIWVANVIAAAPANAPAPQDTVLQGNNIFFNTGAANVKLENAINTQAAYNYLSGARAGVVASTNTTGFHILNSATATIFENTVSEIGSRAIVQDTAGNASTNLTFFRNRFLKGTNIPPPTQSDGKNGITYSILPAQVQWDGGSLPRRQPLERVPRHRESGPEPSLYRVHRQHQRRPLRRQVPVSVGDARVGIHPQQRHGRRTGRRLGAARRDEEDGAVDRTGL